MGLVVFGFFVVFGFSQCVILGLRFSGNNRSFDGYPQRFGTFWGYRKAFGHDARKFPQVAVILPTVIQCPTASRAPSSAAAANLSLTEISSPPI